MPVIILVLLACGVPLVQGKQWLDESYLLAHMIML